MSIFNASAFRKYDIRGRVDDDLHDEFVTSLGKAYGTVIRRSGGSTVALGRDCRLSGERIFEGFKNGILSTGIHVVTLGIVPTPLVYFALHQTDIDGGVSITGSHNPIGWNGFKLCRGTESIYGEGIQELYRLMTNGDFDRGHGTSRSLDLKNAYISTCLSSLMPVKKTLSVVIDAGNGTAGIVAGDLYRRMGVNVEELYCTPDGRFPNHHPDPTVEANIAELRERVLSSGADLGLAFDGDADRLGAIDSEGRIVWGDQLLTFFGLSLLEHKPDARIVGEVKCSKVMYDTLRTAGAQVEMWKVGHSMIKARMRETQADLAGEMSGHLFFADRYLGYDDAVYAGARLIELVGQSEKTLSQWVDSLPTMSATPEIRVACPDAYKFEVTQKAADYFSDRYTTNRVDGVRIEFPEGWGLLRASNTQPVIVMRFEATTVEHRDACRREVEEWLRTHAPDVNFEMDTHHS